MRHLNSLLPLPPKELGRKSLATKGKPGLGELMRGLRPKSTRRRTTSSRYADGADLAEEEEFDDEMDVDEGPPEEEEEDSDDEYKEESGGHYAGTIGRLNTKAYPGNFTQPPGGMASLHHYEIPPGIKQVGKGSRVGSQNVTMGQHYRPAGSPLF